MATKKPLPAYLRSSEDLNYDALDQFLGTLNQAQPEPELGNRGALRGMGDVALSAGRGAVQGVRMLSDLGGSDNAVSKGLRSVEDYIGGLRSAQAKQDDQKVAEILQAAEGAGILDQVVAGAKAFSVAPVSTLAQAVGTSLPTLATAAIPGVGPAAVATRMGAALGLGAAQGAGSVKGQIYDTVKQELTKAGAAPEEAEARAIKASSYADSGDQIALGAALGAWAGRSGIESSVERILHGTTKKAIPGTAARVGMGSIAEGIPEAAQAGQEQYAGNKALYKQGFDTDPMSGVVAHGVFEGIAGAGMGAVAGLPRPRMTPGDQLRAEGLQPEIGPFTRASNKTVEAAAKIADANPALGWNQLHEPEGGFNGKAPMYVFPDGSAATRDEAAQVIAGNTALKNIEQWVARSPRPMPQAEAEALAQAASQKTGQPMAPLPLPDGSGWTVVPQAWINTPAIADYMEQATAANAVEMERQQRIAEIQAAPVDRAPRERTPEPAPPAQPADLVQTYVDQRRNDGTPAGRAFAQDFDAGRITRADVQGLIDTARPQSADDRLAAAAAQAPKPQALQPGDLLNPKGEPFKNQRAATTTAQREGGSVIVVDGGWAVRKATDAPATAAAAGPRDADGERSTRTGVLRDQQPADLPVSAERPADQGAEQPAAAVVRAGRAAEPAPALSPDADLPTLKKAWSEAAAAGDTERAREINDRIVALKKAPAAPASLESDSNPVTSGSTQAASSTGQAPVKQTPVVAQSGTYTVSDAISGDGPANETVKLVVRPDGTAVIQRDNGDTIDVTNMVRAGFSAERAIAQSIGDDTSGANVKRAATPEPTKAKGSKKAAEIKAKQAQKMADAGIVKWESTPSGGLRHRFTTNEGMDGQVHIAPPGWRKGVNSFEVTFDRTGGPKGEDGKTKFYPTKTIGKYRNEEAARKAAEQVASDNRFAAKNPAPVAPESAAATTEGAANGDQAQEEAQGLLKTDKAEIRPYRRADGSIGYEAVPIMQSGPAPEAKPQPSANTVFTEDAAAAARARLKAKLGRLQSGIDPETMMDGITLAGYHIEKGARTFAAYARAMVDDLGDAVKPYLQSWYMAVRADPRAGAFKADMDKASAVEDVDVDAVLADSGPTPPADQAQNAAKETSDATLKLDRPGPPALAGAPAEDVRAPEGGRNPAGEADGSGGRDGARPAEPDGAGVQLPGSVGAGARDVPVSAGGKGRKPRSAGKRGVQDSAGDQPGLGFTENAGGTGGLIPVNPAPNAEPVPSPAFTPEDFTIEDDLGLGEGGAKTKYRGNVDAIRLLRDLEATGRMATPSEQKVLAKYVGWGGLAQAFDADKADWSKEHAELKALLTPEEWDAAARSTRYAHYTSREIIVDGIYAALRRMGFRGGRTLEGGAGVGNFIGLMPVDMRSASRFTAIEREPFSAAIARHLYPKQNVQEADFTAFVGNDDFYDAAVGNPPFASDPQVDTSGRKHLNGLSLHNYFFAKEVDMLREGGILAQVITNGFLDAKADTARRYISDRTKLLGAIRLPNNAFSKNAGTEVTTDLIFLQKRPESEWGGKAARLDAKRWLDIGEHRDAEGRVVPLNQYFIDNPQMMLGKFGAYGTMYRGESPALVQKPGQDTAALLRQAVEALPADIYADRAASLTTAMEQEVVKALRDPTVQEGGYFLQDGKLQQRIKDIAGEARSREITAGTKWTEKTTLGDNGVARLTALAEIRTTLRALLAAELSSDPAMDALRGTLNQKYDAYVKDHGLINDKGTLRVFDDDPDFPLLSSLEHGYTPGIGVVAARSMGIKPVPAKASKAPIFTRRVIDARKQVQQVKTPADALAVSMAERGKLDSAYIGKLLGRNPDEVLAELADGDKPLLFRDPATDEYVLRDAYLSGNVRAKLIQAKQSGMFGNIRALEDVQPEDVGAHEIVARVGSPWVPARVYEDFAKALFGPGTKASIRYVKLSAGYTVSITPENSIASTNTWGTTSYPGDDILASLLNNRPIRVTYRDADGNLQTDKAATEAANIKAQDVRNKFQDWLFTDAERSEVLVRAYNDTNNNYVTREFDGSWMTFPGKVPDAIVKFRRHQRNAIARIVQDRTALLDHVVGAGKTYTVIAAAMELKRTGLSKKPLIVVPNHLVKQWAADFYRLYPGANILTATKKDFEKDNRRKFLAKIATGDWDAVIMAHSSFGFVKPAPDFETQFNTKQIKAIVDTIKQVEDGDGDKQQKKRTVKQLEGLKERLENRIKSLRDKPMDALLDFDEIGVDQLFVDEAHLFKNLMFSTKMQNIAGLGDSKGSQRAYDMFVKTNEVMAKNGRGQGVVFATGTPVSNSLAEMYHMMRYLMPDAMEEMGFQSFDAWANTYASVEQVWMQKASGDGFKAQNRMSNFVNTPELLKVFDQVSDTVTMDDIKSAFREENDGKEFPLPKLKGGKRTPVSMRKSAAQNAYMATIAERAQRLEARKGPPQKGDDNILVLMTDARKAAMDIRLVDPTITAREPGGRIDRSAQEIAARYKQYDQVKGTQLVFSDLGTPLKTVKKELAEFQELQARIEAGSGEDVQIAANLGNEAALAKLEDAEAAQEELDAKGRDWVGAMQAAQRGFSVYDDLKAALIEKGIPEAEIAFIHDFNTDEQKAGLFRKVNAGQIRVLMGSTPKLGAGTNVQERLVALHHLDVPWKPSDVEQREGRIIRQGNLLDSQMPGFEVEVLAYVTQDSLDMRMWQVQETKLKMINQLRTRKVGREVDNAFEDLELSAGEMQAAATGNMDLLREIQLRSDIKKLEQRKRAFDAQKTDLQNRRKNVEQTLAALPAKIEQSRVMAEGEAEYRKALAARTFSATINGKTYTDPKAAGEVLQVMVDAKTVKFPDGKGGWLPKTYTQAEVEAGLPEKDGIDAEAMKLKKEQATPLSVELNGETFTSRAKLADAFAAARGDVRPIAWTFNGTEYARRVPLADALRQDAADAMMEQAPREIGSIGPFAVTIEGGKSSWGDYVEVLLQYGGKEVSTTVGGQEDAAKLAGDIINAAENMAGGAQQQYSYQQHQLKQALKQKDELDATPAPGEWPEADKLTKAREAHQKILRNLAAAGATVAAPEPGSTIETLQGDMQATGTAENDTDVVFSRTRGRGISTRDAKAVVATIRSALPNAPDIVLHETVAQAPEGLQDKIREEGAEDDVEAVYWNGEIHAFPKHMESVERALFVIGRHEVRHHGMRTRYGKKLDETLMGMWRGNQALRQATQAIIDGGRARASERVLAIEEALADLPVAEIAKLKGFDRFVAAMRDWLRMTAKRLRAGGFGLLADAIEPKTWTDADVAAFVLKAEQVSGKGGTGTAFSRRPDTMAPAVTVDRDADTGAPVYATDDITIGFPQKTERFEYLGGQNLINYSIGPADGFDSYGMVELEIGPDGVPIGLADIEIKPEYRGRDIGAKVVEAILAAHPGLDLDISNIVEGARGFWSRLGIPEQNRASGEAYDGTLNWTQFSQAQNARRADRAGARGRAAGEGRNAQAEGGAPGAGGQAPGQAQGGVARFSRRPRSGTEEEARAAGYTVKAYRGVSKASPFNDSGTTWMTTSREVAEAYAEEVMGYDDPDVLTVMVRPDDLPRHDASRLTDEQRAQLGADDFGNPQSPGIYDRSDDHPLGGSRRNVTVIHAPNDAVWVVRDEGRAMFSRATGMAEPWAMKDRLTTRAIQERFGDLLTTQRAFNWWHRTVGTQFHKAKIDADFKRVYDATQNYLHDTSAFANDPADLAPDLLPQLKTLGDIKRGLSLPKEDRAKLGAAVFEGTLNWTRDDSGQPVEAGLDDTAGIVWTPAELRSRFDFSDSQVKLYQQFRAATDRSLDTLVATDVARLLGDALPPGMRDMIATGDLGRFKGLMLAMAQAEGQLDPELAQQITDKFDRIDQLKAQGYAPLQRFGRYTVDVMSPEGERLYFGLFESQAEANAKARQFRQVESDSTVTQGILSEEAYKQFQGLTPETLELFAEVAGVEKNEIFQEYLRRAKNNRSALKRLIKRKGIEGYSEDTSRVLANFITSNARAAAGNLHLGDMTQAVASIPKEKGDVIDEAVRLKDYVQNPQEEAQAIRGLLFAQYLGGSVASAMVNMTQPLMMTWPYLSQFGGSIKAASRLTAAMKAALGSYDRESALGKALALAEKEGIVSPQEMHQLQAEASGALAGHPALRRLQFAWGSLFSAAEQFNRRITFVAAWNTAVAEGIDNPAQFAENAIAETQGVYNKGNKPRWARGAVGATVFTFKQYSVSYMEFLKRLPTKQRALALAVLILAAGAQGMPGADDLDDLIDTLGQGLGYDTNAKLWKTRALSAAIGSDGADFVLRGFSALPGFPLDVAGRLGLGNLIPGTGLLLKSKIDKAGEVTEALGPAASLASGVVKAIPKAATGDVGGALDAMGPKAIKDLRKALEMYQTGEYRDTKGRKVAEATMGDAIAKAIGFQPASIAADSRRVQMANQQIALAKVTEAEIADQIAQARVAGDADAERKARQRLARWNEDNPESRIVITAPQIIRRVREIRTSRDDRFVRTSPKEMRQGIAEIVR